MTVEQIASKLSSPKEHIFITLHSPWVRQAGLGSRIQALSQHCHQATSQDWGFIWSHQPGKESLPSLLSGCWQALVPLGLLDWALHVLSVAWKPPSFLALWASLSRQLASFEPVIKIVSCRGQEIVSHILKRRPLYQSVAILGGWLATLGLASAALFSLHYPPLFPIS